jgi:hypothetical protein
MASFLRTPTRTRPARRPRPLALEPLEPREVPASLRIVTYNIEADVNGVTAPRAGLYEVLEGIGEEVVQGNHQPLDVLALEETTSNTTTVDPIVTNLNTFYANGGSPLAVYARSPYQATQSGSPTTGNGPNALVYNTLTLNLLASVGVGTPQGSSNGEYRQVVRYEFQPVGAAGSTGVFYLYVEHAKAGTTTADFTARNQEAQIVRTDEATLPASAQVIYAGDLNTTASTDASYQTLTAATSPGGAAQGQGFDPLNRPGSWDLNAAFKDILTESAPDLRYRDDHEIVTQNLLNRTGAVGYVGGSYHTFGVNGSTAVNGSVNDGTDTALNADLVQDGPTFIPASTLYSDLTTASDHLPVVADYTSPATATALSSSIDPSASGQSVTFTAVVTGGTSTPTGTVTFKDGPTTLGTVPLNANGGATFATSALAVGTHTVTAVYAGDAAHVGSTSPAVSQVVNPGNLVVTNFTTTPTGYRATFSAALDTTILNAFAAAGTTGPADVTLVGGTTGPVAGSVLLDPTGTALTFVKAGGYKTGTTDFTKFLLAPDTYTVTFRSAAPGTGDNGGVRDATAAHNLLAGNGTTPGTNYTSMFTVGASSARVVSVPDFARGYHQSVDVSTPGTATGLPVTVSDGTGLTHIVLDLAYDPTLLTVTGGTPQAGFTGTINTGTAGLVHLDLTGTGAAGPLTFATLTAAVPDTAPYKGKEVLDLRNLSLNSGSVPAAADDGVHVAAFLGDADGSGGYSAQDASLLLQLAAQGLNGLPAFALLDPAVIGTVGGIATVSAQDASLILQAAAGQTVPQIPPLPTGITPPPTGGPDPTLYLVGAAARPGRDATAQLRMAVADPAGVEVTDVTGAIRFDPTRVRVSGATAGSLLPGFTLSAAVDPTAGVVRFALSGPALRLPFGADGDVLRIDLAVLPTARPGPSQLNLLNSWTDAGGTTVTAVRDGDTTLTLTPAPTDGPADRGVDSMLLVLGRYAALDVVHCDPDGDFDPTGLVSRIRHTFFTNAW